MTRPTVHFIVLGGSINTAPQASADCPEHAGVLASRVPGGPIVAKTCDFPGSEIDLLGRGLSSAGNQSAHKAAAAGSSAGRRSSAIRHCNCIRRNPLTFSRSLVS